MKRPRVILVEDETLVAMMMEDLLADLGCDIVGSFADLSLALRWLAAQDDPPDGAVLDVNLGGQMVFPLAEALERRGVPFAFATGYGALSEPRFQHAPVLHKPVDEARLAPIVRRFSAA